MPLTTPKDNKQIKMLVKNEKVRTNTKLMMMYSVRNFIKKIK